MRRSCSAGPTRSRSWRLELAFALDLCIGSDCRAPSVRTRHQRVAAEASRLQRCSDGALRALIEKSFLSLTTRGFHHVAYNEWGKKERAQTVVCVHGLTRNSRDFD